MRRDVLAPLLVAGGVLLAGLPLHATAARLAASVAVAGSFIGGLVLTAGLRGDYP